MAGAEEQEDLFGTEPHKLARKHDPWTSHVAAEAVDSTQWEQRVYACIEALGKRGAIQDEVIALIRRRYGKVAYSTVTARFKALEEKGLITYDGRTRKGESGRPSRVRVAKKFAKIDEGGSDET